MLSPANLNIIIYTVVGKLSDKVIQVRNYFVCFQRHKAVETFQIHTFKLIKNCYIDKIEGMYGVIKHGNFYLTKPFHVKPLLNVSLFS